MSKRKPNRSDKSASSIPNPASFFQVGMPFWQMLLETDTPGFVFQPMKAMALGQIQALDLINKRCLACLEMPQKLAACRTPEDFMRENQRFFQDALRDYSAAAQAMAQVWDVAVAGQTGSETETETHHDYLPLPNDKPDDVVEDPAPEPTQRRRSASGNGMHSHRAFS